MNMDMDMGIDLGIAAYLVGPRFGGGGGPAYVGPAVSPPPTASPPPPPRPSEPAIFELRAASKRFGAEQALGPTDLRFPAGRTTVLIGPSGCGKTTVLRLLLGLVLPDQGEVRFRGQPMDPRDLRQYRQQMGYLVQDGGLFPHLTARQNVTLMARHLGRDPAEGIARRLGELTDLVHLPAEALDRYPLELSGGQRQRVSLMRALMLDPEVLLLDEPLGAIDPRMRAELQEDLAAIFQRLGKSVVMVTHDLGEAVFFAGEGGALVLMRAGQVVQEGTPRDLLERPADPFVTRFVAAQRRPSLGQQP